MFLVYTYDSAYIIIHYTITYQAQLTHRVQSYRLTGLRLIARKISQLFQAMRCNLVVFVVVFVVVVVVVVVVVFAAAGAGALSCSVIQTKTHVLFCSILFQRLYLNPNSYPSSNQNLFSLPTVLIYSYPNSYSNLFSLHTVLVYEGGGAALSNHLHQSGRITSLHR